MERRGTETFETKDPPTDPVTEPTVHPAGAATRNGHSARVYDVLALGELLVDFTTRPVPGTSPHSGPSAFSLVGDAGGAPANVLAAVTKLGGRAGFIGKVGADEFGSFLASTLEHYGIDCVGLRVSNEALTTLAFVTLSPEGERSFSFKRQPGADTLLEPTDIPPDLLDQTLIFHFGSLSMTNEPARSATLDAARRARRSGCVVTYDPNWRPLLWSNQAEAIQQMLVGVELADVVKVSEEELGLLTGTTELAGGTLQLLRRGPRLVLVTLGERGCFYASALIGTGLVPSVTVSAVDTTGSGDAFMGGFLWQLSQHRRANHGSQAPNDWTESNLREAIRFANAVGALTAASHGTMSAMPMKDRVLEVLAAGGLGE